MAEPGRNPKHLLILFAQPMSRPLTKGRRAAPKIDGDVKYLSSHRPNQLALRLDELIMQSAENAPFGARMVVLHESLANAEFRESALVIALQKKSPAVRE